MQSVVEKQRDFSNSPSASVDNELRKLDRMVFVLNLKYRSLAVRSWHIPSLNACKKGNVFTSLVTHNWWSLSQILQHEATRSIDNPLDGRLVNRR